MADEAQTNSSGHLASRSRLSDLALLFLRLGVTAFGGPAAHIAMMEDEVVNRRRWISADRFLDMLGAANLIPGPSSSELAIFIGYEQAGYLGLVVAGACFVLPAALITGAIAWAYVRFGSLPHVAGLLYGIKPVVIAVIVQAIWGLAPKAIKRSRSLAALGILACLATALNVDILAVLVGAGIVSALGHTVRTRKSMRDGERLFFAAPFVATVTASLPATLGLGTLFLTFLKLGAIVFGSGYVLLAFLRADLVERHHWMTESQLIDAVAVGQITPGPVFSTATFIGYVLSGFPGAVVATIAIFLPGFALVAVIGPLVGRLRRSPTASAFLDGVTVASIALMAFVTVQLGRTALKDWITLVIASVSAVLLVRFKINSTWLIAGGALVGALAQGLR